MDRRVAGREPGEPGDEDPSPLLSRILGILGLPHEVDRDGPVRDALVIQTYRLARPGPERDAVRDAILALIGMEDRRLLLPVRGVRLGRALALTGCREAEEAARRAGILPFHGDDVLERAGQDLLKEVAPLLRSPRRVTRMAGRVLDLVLTSRRPVLDEPTLRHVRRLATGVRARRRGARER